MDIRSLKMDDVCAPDALESLVARRGGAALVELVSAQRAACAALQGALSHAQRPLFLAYADAAADVAGLREEAAVGTALALGLGLGAILADFPEAPPDAVVETASGVFRAVLAADFPQAVAVARRAAALMPTPDPAPPDAP